MDKQKKRRTIRVATYNIHSCVGTDRRFSPYRILDAIQEIDADILALQEVGWHQRGERYFNQFQFLSHAAGYQVVEGLTRHHADAHYGNAILSRLPIEDSGNIPLSLRFHSPRTAVHAVINCGDHKLKVVNVHLGLTPWERARQVDRVLDSLNGSKKSPAILMGDVNNFQPDALPFQRLTDYFPKVASPRSFHARLPSARLDRIYLTDELDFHDHTVWRTNITRRASDHLPVVGEIILPE